ncbi:MAG: hypothetical protein SOU18_04925 [Alloprevotella sp.]|nr:hypothetical protein [Alloprevotella sp.]
MPAFHGRGMLAMSVSGMAFGFPRFFLRLFRFFLRLFRFSSADSQRPAGAGRVTRGRRSLAISQKEMILGLMRFTATAMDFVLLLSAKHAFVSNYTSLGNRQAPS